MSAIDGADSFKDAVRQTAIAVIRELYRVLVVQQMVNAAMGCLGYRQHRHQVQRVMLLVVQSILGKPQLSGIRP